MWVPNEPWVTQPSAFTNGGEGVGLVYSGQLEGTVTEKKGGIERIHCKPRGRWTSPDGKKKIDSAEVRTRDLQCRTITL